MLGIEGSETWSRRSRENYEKTRLKAPAHKALAANFVARNLFEMTPEMLVADGRPTNGWSIRRARRVCLSKALADIEQARLGRRCRAAGRRAALDAAAAHRLCELQPATLARDAGLLVHQAGYRCTAAGWSTCSRAHGTR